MKLELMRFRPDFGKVWEERRHTCFHLLSLSASSFLEPGAMDPVSIYDSEDSYTDIPQKSLPNPKKSKVLVKIFDRPTKMGMFVHDGREMWVSQSEVELSEKAVASIICTQMKNRKGSGNSEISSRETVTYGTLGLGERVGTLRSM